MKLVVMKFGGTSVGDPARIEKAAAIVRRSRERGEIFAACEVLGERYNDEGVIFRVRARPEMLERLQAA